MGPPSDTVSVEFSVIAIFVSFLSSATQLHHINMKKSSLAIFIKNPLSLYHLLLPATVAASASNKQIIK